MTTCHNQRRFFECPHCTSSFTRKPDLRRHMPNRHKDINGPTSVGASRKRSRSPISHSTVRPSVNHLSKMDNNNDVSDWSISFVTSYFLRLKPTTWSSCRWCSNCCFSWYRWCFFSSRSLLRRLRTLPSLGLVSVWPLVFRAEPVDGVYFPFY